jgi:hypothetical protein
VAAASLRQNRRDREPPLFSLFFHEKTAPRPAKPAEFLGFWQSLRSNNSEKQRAITAKNSRKRDQKQ